MPGPVNSLIRTRDAWLGLPGNVRGVFWLLMYTVSFAGADVLAKTMGLQINLLVILFLRYFISLFFIVPVVLYLGVGVLKTERPGVHALRATISVTAQLLVYYALINMYVADVTAIGFTRPLFVTFLAVWFLSETVGWRRWVATGIGFAGVFIMVGPAASEVNYAAAGAALLGTLMFGVAMVMVRRFAPTEPPIRFVFYYHLGGAVLALGPAIYFWETPTLVEFGFIVAIALTSTIAMTCGIRAYSVGEVSIVGPVEYVRLLFAAVLGYVVFAETPGMNTWVGATVIIAATLYIARYEAVKRAVSQGCPGLKRSP